MAPADGISLLVEATLASSAAIATVLLLRQRVRHRFGARIAYALWFLVPAALVAVSLPAATVAVPVAVVLPPGHTIPMAVGQARPAIDATTVAVLAWSIGMLLTVTGFVFQQQRFRRALGTLRPRADGTQQASATRGLPAAFGLLRPRIVVPADFDRRFSAEQQMLMQAHERSHIRGGDLHANAVVAALRCLFWFNPLVHVASRHFRHDQELACDQRVIARHPKSRRAYGEAMLKAQLAVQSLPAGCHWGYGHPLKERIAMLNQPVPSRARWAAGSAAVVTLTLAVACAAWAAQPPRPVTDQLAGISGERTPPPRYPEAAAKEGIGGKVVLVVDVGADGRVRSVEVESAEPAGVFDQAAVDAARQWTFHPQIKGGEPVAGKVRVPIWFTPDESPAGLDKTALPPPAYPAAAVEQKVSGTVVLVIDVDATGAPVDVAVESSEPAGVFDQAAVDAVSKWKFNPQIEDGKPVAGRVRVPVTFEIPPGGEKGAGLGGAGLDLASLGDSDVVRSAACNKVAGSLASGPLICVDD